MTSLYDFVLISLKVTDSSTTSIRWKLSNAFDTVAHDIIWKNMHEMGLFSAYHPVSESDV